MRVRGWSRRCRRGRSMRGSRMMRAIRRSRRRGAWGGAAAAQQADLPSNLEWRGGRGGGGVLHPPPPPPPPSPMAPSARADEGRAAADVADRLGARGRRALRLGPHAHVAVGGRRWHGGGVVVHLGAQRTRVRALLPAWVAQHGGADARVRGWSCRRRRGRLMHARRDLRADVAIRRRRRHGGGGGGAAQRVRRPSVPGTRASPHPHVPATRNARRPSLPTHPHPCRCPSPSGGLAAAAARRRGDSAAQCDTRHKGGGVVLETPHARRGAQALERGRAYFCRRAR